MERGPLGVPVACRDGLHFLLTSPALGEAVRSSGGSIRLAVGGGVIGFVMLFGRRLASPIC